MSEILGLIERLEKATGPSRELDLEIARLQGVTVMRRNDDDTANIEHTYWNYTASLDAALPGESIRSMMMLADGRFEAQALDASGNYHVAEAATEALARRIAALRARSPGTGQTP